MIDSLYLNAGKYIYSFISIESYEHHEPSRASELKTFFCSSLTSGERGLLVQLLAMLGSLVMLCSLPTLICGCRYGVSDYAVISHTGCPIAQKGE